MSTSEQLEKKAVEMLKEEVNQLSLELLRSTRTMRVRLNKIYEDFLDLRLRGVDFDDTDIQYTVKSLHSYIHDIYPYSLDK